MKKIFSLLVGFFLFCSVSFAGNYTLNDDNVNALIEDASEMSILEIKNTFSANEAMSAAAFNLSPTIDDEVLVAFVLCLVFGGLGIHRVYMGGSPILVLYYIITCGGIFGVVTLIDLVSLIIKMVNDEGIGSYGGNDAFFGWK